MLPFSPRVRTINFFRYFENETNYETTQNENIFGCQFHPERSGKQCIRILENFLNL